jgi:cytochrome c-type biogenesis protein CcmH/NrfF
LVPQSTLESGDGSPAIFPEDLKPSVKDKILPCVSKVEMSPITAKLKCPHGRGKDIDESEAVTEARGDGFG